MEKLSATPPQGTSTPHPTLSTSSERPEGGALYDYTTLAAEVAPGKARHLIGPIGKFTRHVVGAPEASEMQVERKGIASRLRRRAAMVLEILQREPTQRPVHD